MTFTISPRAISIALLVFQAGALVWLFISRRRVERYLRSSGYWRGRSDDSLLHMIEHRLGDQEREISLYDVRQLVSQQATQANVGLPHGFPEWDEVDRLALYLEPEEIEALLVAPERATRARRRWWDLRRAR